MRSHYFYTGVFGFCAGIISASSWPINLTVIVLLFVVSILSGLFLIAFSISKKKRLLHEFLIIFFFFITLTFGIFRQIYYSKSLNQSGLSDYINKEISIAGVAKSDATYGKSNLILDVYAISDKGLVLKVKNERILVRSVDRSLSFGDLINVRGVLSVPDNFSKEDGLVFDYVNYLRKDRINYFVDRASVFSIESSRGTLLSKLHKINKSFVDRVSALVTYPESVLATGVTIAGKGDLPLDIKDDFTKAGLIHIVVLSGYNISLVVSFMVFVFSFLGRRVSYVFSILGIIVFILIAGVSPPIVRAGIMASILIIGKLSYKNILQNRALFVAGVIMIFVNPLILLHDASFALSFLATYAIINISPILNINIPLLKGSFGINRSLNETVATQVFVLPYLLYEIGRISIIAPVSNIIVLPFIPSIMIICFIVGLLSPFTVLAIPFAGALIVLCSFVINVSHYLAIIPFASVDIKISAPTMVVIYVLYFVIFYFKASIKRKPLIS